MREIPVDRLTFEQAKKELTDLIALIQRYDALYYQHSTSAIDDAAYDALRVRLQAIERKYPSLVDREGSPSFKVGAPPSQGLVKVSHREPMLSLANGFTWKEVENFIERLHRFLNLPSEEWLSLIAEPKIDGVSLSLFYIDGVLTQALTRGDGLVGEDVTRNIRKIGAIPQRLEFNPPSMLEVRGEVYMEREAFLVLNAARHDQCLSSFSTARNATSGAIRHLEETSSQVLAILKFAGYGWGSSSVSLGRSHREGRERLLEWGVPLAEPAIECEQTSDLLDYYRDLTDRRFEFPFEMDGVVYKVNDLEYRNRLGTVRRSPRWAIAYKFAAHSVRTKIRDIAIQVGRSGVLTPVALLEPVLLNGVMLSRATLHNPEEIRRKDIRIGDTVVLERAGDVIPKITSVVTTVARGATKFDFPRFCPECGTESVQESSAFYCPSSLTCKGQRIERLYHFAQALEIVGLGKKTIERLYDLGFLTHPGDIFDLARRDQERDKPLRTYHGWGKVSVETLWTEIERKRQAPLDKVIFALGIRHVGIATARLLAAIYQTFDRLSQAMVSAQDRDGVDYQELLSIDQIGASSAESLVTFFHANHSAIESIAASIEILPFQSREGSPLLGKNIVFTGVLESMSRQEAKARAEASGAKVFHQVSSKTAFVVAGKSPGSKVARAKDLNIPILNEAEWLAKSIKRGIDHV